MDGNVGFGADRERHIDSLQSGRLDSPRDVAIKVAVLQEQVGALLRGRENALHCACANPELARNLDHASALSSSRPHTLLDLD